jgi:4-alpha-glucanotransferase
VPLSSLTSRRSWGVGEFSDLPPFTSWLASAGQCLVQILPITEIPDEETSPYSALTAMALDPIYIALPEVEDFQALGGEDRLTGDDRTTLDGLRESSRIEHQLVRPLKSRLLRLAFERFSRTDLAAGGERSKRFAAFLRDESWWLDDYALFQALRRRHRLLAWWSWPEPLAHRHREALAHARDELCSEIEYRKYVQWIAAEQWAAARELSKPLQVFGDVPFMISGDSPDVWTRQDEFRMDATVGAPPDAFSETGQDWGLPPWRWDVMAQNDYQWMRCRARRTASLFDGFRLDHLVGLYRTYIRPRDPAVPPFFAPDDERAQLRLGERLVGIYQTSGAEVIAEDLGTVPEFVRQSLQRLGMPGFKVLRWERQWHAPQHPFIDPSAYPEASVATTGTHDTEPLASWWDALASADRVELLRTPSVKKYLSTSASPLDALLRALLDAGSRLTIIPLQDVFGWRDRINTPGQVDADNWTWRMPWRVDQLVTVPEARNRADLLAAWSIAAGR